MPMFRPISKPVEALQWTGDNFHEMRRWLGYALVDITHGGPIRIDNRTGRVIANAGDFIVKDDGFYPVEPVKFHAEYEAVQ
jgi:hypothetical protein